MPASIMGCFIPNNLVIGVEIVGVLIVEVVVTVEGMISIRTLQVRLERIPVNRQYIAGAATAGEMRDCVTNNCFHNVLIFPSSLDGQLYSIVPTDTRMPPAITARFQPLPNHKILIIRLTALRTVKKRLVCTEEDV
jgi:hypothetical protein